tara:strand:- start:5 stop:535 length:531 start_codon:yes stop_codon:yes gene_type:complete
MTLEIGLISITGSGTIYLVNSYIKRASDNKCMNCEIEIVGAVLSILSLIGLIVSIFFLVRAIFGYTYKLTPKASMINEYYEKFIKYEKELEKENKENKENNKNYLDKMIIKELCFFYAESNEKNRFINIKRSGYRHMSLGWIIFSGFLVLVSAILYGVVIGLESSLFKKLCIQLGC